MRNAYWGEKKGDALRLDFSIGLASENEKWAKLSK